MFALIRLNGGYGNAYSYTSIAQLDFWSFAKYPPDLPFLSFALTVIFLALAALWTVARDHTPALLRPFEIFGRVPFFFYVVHFFVLGLAAGVVGTKVGLPATYLIWLALLVAMLWPCAWYFDKKQNRPNFITRYF